MNANKSENKAAILHGWMAANLKDSDIPKLRLARMVLKDSTLDQYYDESPLRTLENDDKFHIRYRPRICAL